ncbi:BON domain-containing protein [Azohydromonas australica]|uniref:BON domain-containing protein n=1 Tax=Azohydromonas australica TaxID=364039 RepID=UPI0004111B19|nr:BON domain-containing protein [Azohydromonas australica]
MKTDAELKQDVQDELDWDPAVDATAIGAAVECGVVTLAGHLQTYAQKWAVQKALQRVAGVKAYALELDVLLAPNHRRSDTELAQCAQAALQQLAMLSNVGVRPTVDKGWIKLQGEVDWEFQRRLVEKTISHLKGVVGVSNDITLKHHSTPPDLDDRIRRALVRQAEREALHIKVQAHPNGTVTLRGTVHSWHERCAAEGTVRAAPGVRWVVNRIQIKEGVRE